MKRIKTQKGITLIALLVTIVVLIILASIGISSVKEDGIIGHANNQINQYEETVNNYNEMVNDIKNKLKNELTLVDPEPGPQPNPPIINETVTPNPEPDECEHVPGEPVRENEVAATCTTAGSYDEVVYCTVCGEEISRAKKVIEALGHTPGETVRENEVAATCTVAGSYDEVVYCTVCDAEISRNKKTTDAHHSFSPHDQFEVICNEEFEVERTCTTCHKLINIKNPGKWNTHQLNVTVISYPSCTEAIATKRCQHFILDRQCSYVETSTATPRGHKFGEWSTIKEATCTEDGLKERYCENYYDASGWCNFREEEIIPASHSFRGGICIHCKMSK